MVTLVNRAKVATATTGTGTITLGSAESGYQTFADAGVADGDVVRYVIEDGNDWEIGSGTYTATGTTLTRTVSESSNADAALNLTGSAVVYVSAAAEDIPPVLELYAENPVTPTAPSATGNNAVAIGSESVSSGLDSFAIGRNTNAANIRAIVFGGYSQAYGISSVAIGFSSTVNPGGTESSAIGSRAQIGSNAVGAAAINKSYASGTDSFAAAIANNTSSYGATGSNSVAMGYQAKATQTYSTTLGGFRAEATASGATSIGGFDNSASGVYSVALGGRSNTSDGQYSIALGYGAHTQGVNRRVAFAGNGTSGATQSGLFSMSRTTSDATPIALTTEGNVTATTDNQVILPNNSAYAFHGTIVARQQASAGTACAAWKVEGLIRREGSAGTTVLVNSATTVLDNTPAWGMALSADTTNGGLKIEVTGAAATNIRFVSTIHTSEVTY